MKTEALVIDADGHILEPPDLWEKYLESKYRAEAIRLRIGDDGYEYLEVAGARAKMGRAGQLGTLGGMGKQVEEARRRREHFVSEGKAEQLRFTKSRPEDTYSKARRSGPWI
jgi:hypothetical protein